jgi:hypothetical protein
VLQRPYSTQGYAKTVHCVHCFHGVPLKLHQIAPRIKEKISNRKGDSIEFDSHSFALCFAQEQARFDNTIQGKKRESQLIKKKEP